MNEYAICIVAFNRVDSLSRLLRNIETINFGKSVSLIISIDNGGDSEVLSLANRFNWTGGPKEVLARDSHLGLKEHVLACGKLTRKYKNLLILEDDLYLSPYFHDFMFRAVDFYKDNDQIAGISLFSNSYNETAKMKFRSIDDGSDVFFMQIPSSWGQMWTSSQWNEFEEWYEKNQILSEVQVHLLPQDVQLWPDSSWKKFFYAYMIEKNKYFCYPKSSYACNFVDEGVNHVWGNIDLQVPLVQHKKEIILIELSSSTAIYDHYCEWNEKIAVRSLSKKGIIPKEITELTMDLYGVKPLEVMSTEYVLTSKKVKKSIKSFLRALKPQEQNLIDNLEGGDFHLVHRKDIMGESDEKLLNKVGYYYDVPLFILDGVSEASGITDLKQRTTKNNEKSNEQ